MKNYIKKCIPLLLLSSLNSFAACGLNIEDLNFGNLDFKSQNSFSTSARFLFSCDAGDIGKTISIQIPSRYILSADTSDFIKVKFFIEGNPVMINTNYNVSVTSTNFNVPYHAVIDLSENNKYTAYGNYTETIVVTYDLH